MPQDPIPGQASTSAWLWPRDEPERRTQATEASAPDLRLRILVSTQDALTAELVEGDCPSRNALIYVSGRGLFAIFATVRSGARLYLRGRSWSPALEWSA